MRITEKFVEWCRKDTAAARFERSIIQGIIAALVVGITTGDYGVSFAVAAIMAIISPIQKAIGNSGNVQDSQESDGK